MSTSQTNPPLVPPFTHLKGTHFAWNLLKLILGYLTIFPSSESPFSTLVHFPSSESILKQEYNPLTCTAIYTLKRDMLGLKPPSGRLSIQGLNRTHPWAGHKDEPSALIPLAGKIWERMKPHSTQNLKASGLWVFFLICCSTFSFLLNMRLRLTLEYLIIFSSTEVPLPHWYNLS